MPRRLPRPLPLAALALVAAPRALAAQGAPPARPGADSLPPLAIGFGVDTSAISPFWGDGPWRAPLPAIYRSWRAYLATRRDGPGAPAPRTRSPYWNAAEQRRWPEYDLAASVAYQGFDATVLDIRPLRPARLDAPVDTFVVKTLFARADTARGRTEIRPLAITRVLAFREGGRWVFGNPLAHDTRDWPRHRVGPITYVVHPAHRFDRARAESAVRFADSLAAAFDVPRLARLDYHVTDDPDAMFRLMGVEWTITPDAHGAGYASHRNRQIFVGAPALGEAYLHELAHAVLGPLTPPEARTHPMLVEGLATWVGGSLGFGPRELRAAYAGWLRKHPEVTLDRVIAAEGGDYGWRPGAAALFDLAHARGGLPAVRTLLAATTDSGALRIAIERAVVAPWAEVARLWRERALAPEPTAPRRGAAVTATPGPPPDRARPPAPAARPDTAGRPAPPARGSG